MNKLYYVLYTAYNNRKNNLSKPREAIVVATERVSLILVFYLGGIIRYLGVIELFYNPKQRRNFILLFFFITYSCIYFYYNTFGKRIVGYYETRDTWTAERTNAVSTYFIISSFLFLFSYDLLNLFLKLPLTKYFNL